MNEKKSQSIDVELHCKATGSLNKEVEKELAAEDESLEDLLGAGETIDEPQD
jgi:hypothetical protein